MSQPFTATIDEIIAIAEPRYDYWKNIELLSRYLEALVYCANISQSPDTIQYKLSEIRMQLEEGLFDYETFDFWKNTTVPLWLLVYEATHCYFTPEEKREKQRCCFKVLGQEFSKMETTDEWPIDPTTAISQEKAHRLLQQFSDEHRLTRYQQ